MQPVHLSGGYVQVNQVGPGLDCFPGSAPGVPGGNVPAQPALVGWCFYHPLPGFEPQLTYDALLDGLLGSAAALENVRQQAGDSLHEHHPLPWVVFGAEGGQKF